MDEIEQKLQWWVEYIDDYDIKHLTSIRNKDDLDFLQNNYRIVNIENIKN